MAEVLSTFMLQLGDAAPLFTLPNAHGEAHSWDRVAGKHGTLVVFACNHCPFVVHLADALGQFATEAAQVGVHTVAIASNNLEKYPQDGPQYMPAFAAEHGWDFPYLLDEKQEVAKAYGAACTPDFFLFNGEGKLFYAGQFDSSRPRSGEVASGGDLREALRRMLAGEGYLERPYPSSGCNIKWKPGNEPVWFGAA